jgi:hypothetical protein
MGQNIGIPKAYYLAFMLGSSRFQRAFGRQPFLNQAGRVSGRLVVPIIFGFAILMAGIVFWVGLQEKRSWDHISIPGLGQDSLTVTRADSLQRLMRDWPKEWMQVSRLGERLAVVVPCFSETPKLTLTVDSLDNRVYPLWNCPFCETSDSLSVVKWFKAPTPSSAPSRNEPSNIMIYMQGDSIPWIYRPHGTLVSDAPMASLNGPALIVPREGDSLWFFPTDSLSAVEMVREEDENPEGCQPDENGAHSAEEGESGLDSSSKSSSDP